VVPTGRFIGSGLYMGRTLVVHWSLLVGTHTKTSKQHTKNDQVKHLK